MSHDPADADTAIVSGDAEPREIAPRPRTMTSTAEIDSTISHPGSVRINVKGAFIADGTEQPTTPANGYSNGNGSYHEGKDIRLPNHTAVVSHIAVDVSRCAPNLSLL
jgi:type II pantothenate kinase